METLRMLLPLAWRNLWRNSRRTGITLIVVTAGLYSILVLASFMHAWADSSRGRALGLLTGSGQIHAVGYLEDPTIAKLMPPVSDGLAAVLDNPALMGWAARVAVPAVIQSEYKTLPTDMIGVDPAAERRISMIPDRIAEGRYLDDPDDPGIVLGAKAIDRLKTRIGKRVIILGQHEDGTLAEQSFEVVGAFAGIPELEENVAFVGLRTAQEMLGTDGRLSEVTYRLKDEADTPRLTAAIAAAVPDLDVRDWKTLSPMAAIVDSMMDTMILIWLWVMFVMMAFGIINTQLMAVFERVREFGLLQALGMRPAMVLLIVTLESAILVGAGSVIGIVLAVATMAAFQGGIDISAVAQGAAMAGAGDTLYPKIRPGEIAELSFTVWALGVLVALWPARKAAKSSPVEAMIHVS